MPEKKVTSQEKATTAAHVELSKIAESRKELDAAEAAANAAIVENRVGPKYVSLQDCVSGFHKVIKESSNPPKAKSKAKAPVDLTV